MTAGLLLDTNVVSEFVATKPEPRVVRWLGRQAPEHLFLSVITLGELVYGVARLPSGRRRDRLARWVTDDLPAQFAGRVLSFDGRATRRWGELRALTERMGRPRPALDLQLAATAAASDLTLATRNVADFEGLGLDILDPWTSA